MIFKLLKVVPEKSYTLLKKEESMQEGSFLMHCATLCPRLMYFSFCLALVASQHSLCFGLNFLLQVSQMEHEYSVKEQGLEARVRELEESSRSSSADLTRVLAAQQKSAQRWKEETKNLVQAFEAKITGLK